MSDSGAGPLVSLLTATFNNLEGLQRTVTSVAGQSFTEYEHIVVDGGSSDGTMEWLETNPSGLRWTSEPDEGIADALNKGLGLARGEWILVLHADDTFVKTDSLRLAFPHLNTEAGIVSHDVLFVDGSGTRRLSSKGWTPKINFKTTIPHQGAFVRRSIFERLGTFDTDYAVEMDYEFFLRAYRGGISVVTTGLILSEMPNTGISSRRDWPSLHSRFLEERSIQAKHSPSGWWRLVYAAYWPAYLAYRWLTHSLDPGRGVSADSASR